MSIEYSVIIPTKGRPDRLAVALDGVFKQTVVPDRVFVIVDDLNESGTNYGFLREFGDTLKTVYTGGGAGAARARNIGIAMAPDGYVFFLDDDDEWLPRKCAAQIALLEERKEWVGVTCGRKIVSRDGSESRVIPDASIIARYLNCVNYTGSFSFFGYRKDARTAGVLLDESLPAFQDHEFYMRLGRFGGIGVAGEVLGIYHDHAGNRISTRFKTKADALRSILAKHKGNLTRSETHIVRSKEAHIEMLAASSLGRKLQFFTMEWFHRLIALNPISLPRFLLPKRYSRR